MYKLVRYLKFIVLLNIYNQDAKASHLKLRKNVPLLITIFRYKHAFFALIWNIHARRPAWIFLKKPTLSDFSKVRVS